MNWIKSLWDKLVKSTSTSPTIVLVEEETQEDDPRPIGLIFEHICRSKGAKQADLDSTNAVALFEEWYEGARNEDAIRESIQSFKEAMGGAINAKLNKVK